MITFLFAKWWVSTISTTPNTLVQEFIWSLPMGSFIRLLSDTLFYIVFPAIGFLVSASYDTYILHEIFRKETE